MGFDYVFVGDSESVVSIIVEVYDTDGSLLSRTKSIDVPLMKSKLTTVRGKFLTTDASGGVVVNPDYEGDHNILK